MALGSVFSTVPVTSIPYLAIPFCAGSSFSRASKGLFSVNCCALHFFVLCIILRGRYCRGNSVKLLTDDIKTFPTEIRFVEKAHDLNQIMAQGGEAEYRLTAPLDVTLTHVRSGEDLL